MKSILIPGYMKLCLRLKMIDLRENKIRQLPSSLGRLKCLLVCLLSYNHISELPAGMLIFCYRFLIKYFHFNIIEFFIVKFLYIKIWSIFHLIKLFLKASENHNFSRLRKFSRYWKEFKVNSEKCPKIIRGHSHANFASYSKQASLPTGRDIKKSLYSPVIKHRISNLAGIF